MHKHCCASCSLWKCPASPSVKLAQMSDENKQSDWIDYGLFKIFRNALLNVYFNSNFFSCMFKAATYYREARSLLHHSAPIRHIGLLEVKIISHTPSTGRDNREGKNIQHQKERSRNLNSVPPGPSKNILIFYSKLCFLTLR